ncbi:GNAT family N-acetyltransferase [Achromobacter ruhlandii]|uniref:GNAT family N-acetyltransferase n=1 Tax=Achromobacter ruhlandii TaxID=72557 RepID=UPI003B9EF378
MEHPDQTQLDNPAWFALAGRQAHLRQGDGLAARYMPDVAPFAAVRNTTRDAFDALRRLIAPDTPAMLQALYLPPPLDGLRSEPLFSFFQMIDHGPAPAADDEQDLLTLGAGDVADMMALAAATRPGPFGPRTIETGQYVGMRRRGRLVAMAGERMRLDGYVEISAVCVDASCRGQGLAGRLMDRLRRDIRLRGDTPFLHVRDNNAAAIALYQRLGFRTRQTFQLHRITTLDTHESACL